MKKQKLYCLHTYLFTRLILFSLNFFLTFSLIFLLTYKLFSTTPTANFLKIGVGARNVATGETGATLDDVNSIYWNPAYLTKLHKPQVSFMHAVWLETINYEHIALGYPTRYGVFGGAINYLSMGEMETYDNTGVKQPERITANDVAVTVSYSRNFVIKNVYPFDAGINLKYITSKLEQEQANSICFDIGLGTEISIKGQKVDTGLVLQNIGFGMKFVKEVSPLPFNAKLGFGYILPISKNYNLLRFSVDLNFPSDTTARVNLGTEYMMNFGYNIKLVPRLGFRSNTQGFEKFTGLTAGVGIIYKDYSVDYAFVPYGELGDTHRISVNIAFVPVTTKKEVPPEVKKGEEIAQKPKVSKEVKRREEIKQELKKEERIVDIKEDDTKINVAAILFAFNSSEVAPQAYPVIERIIELFKTYKEYKSISVEGHTDDVGSAEYNMELSKRRSESVAKILVEKYNIPQEKIEIKWFGFTQPIADNSTEEGKAKNRRTEIILNK